MFWKILYTVVSSVFLLTIFIGVIAASPKRVSRRGNKFVVRMDADEYIQYSEFVDSKLREDE